MLRTPLSSGVRGIFSCIWLFVIYFSIIKIFDILMQQQGTAYNSYRDPAFDNMYKHYLCICSELRCDSSKVEPVTI